MEIDLGDPFDWGEWEGSSEQEDRDSEGGENADKEGEGKRVQVDLWNTWCELNNCKEGEDGEDGREGD